MTGVTIMFGGRLVSGKSDSFQLHQVGSTGHFLHRGIVTDHPRELHEFLDEKRLLPFDFLAQIGPAKIGGTGLAGQDTELSAYECYTLNDRATAFQATYLQDGYAAGFEWVTILCPYRYFVAPTVLAPHVHDGATGNGARLYIQTGASRSLISIGGSYDGTDWKTLAVHLCRVTPTAEVICLRGEIPPFLHVVVEEGGFSAMVGVARL